jgi:tetratricopeptide (TPR) repeat protein
MSRRKLVLLVSVAGALVGGVYLGVAWYSRAQVAQQLEAAREELRAALAATRPEERQAHARACFAISESLVGEEDPIAATAALFSVSVAPIAGAAKDVAVPEAERVEQIPTPDLLLMIQAFSETGRVVPAGQLLDLALSRDDESREDTLVLACAIRLDLGRDAEVLGYCDELIELDDTAASPYRMQAAVHRLHGRWDHYVQALENARARTATEDPILQVELIDGYTRLGRFDEAQQEFKKLKSTHPELIPSMPTVHARLLIQQGDFKQAEEILTKYLETDPTDSEALMLKGKVLVDTGQFEAAVEVLKKALEYDPSAQDAHFQIGQTYARLGKKELANQHLALHRKLLDSKVRLYELEQKAAEEPQNVDVRRELAKIYAEIQLPSLAAFWERAAIAAEGN